MLSAHEHALATRLVTKKANLLADEEQSCVASCHWQALQCAKQGMIKALQQLPSARIS